MRFSSSLLSRTSTIFASCLSALMVTSMPNVTEASCGAASCFLNIGNQPSVQPKGTLRADLSYSYVPQRTPNRRVAAVVPESKEQILDEHFEISTITQQFAMNLNYGVTDNFTLQLTVPVLFRDHDHRVEVGEGPEDAVGGHHEGEGVFENFDTAGLGDIRLMAKYGFIPSLRTLLVVGGGVEFPTGNYQAQVSGHGGNVTQEPTLQAGRGDYGVLGHIYQAYELIPHTLNQFFSYTYRHTFQNKFGYQFGDTHIVSGGLIYNLTPGLAFSGQLNWIYNVHDTFRSTLLQSQPIGTGLSGEPTEIDGTLARRPVRNTGSTNLLLTPGVTFNFNDSTSWYFYSQIPLVQDFNDGLKQGVSFLTGFVKFFNIDATS